MFRLQQSTSPRGSAVGRPSTFLVLAEFSEIAGPETVKIVPPDPGEERAEIISNFVVQAMSVDYTGSHAGVPTFNPADTCMVYNCTKWKVSAIVHFFNLHDRYARGYSRVFTLSYLTFGKDLVHIEETKRSFEATTAQCHQENLFRFYGEMRAKREGLPVTAETERSQVDWWLTEMEKSHRLTNNYEEFKITSTPPQSNDRLRDISELLPVAYKCLVNTMEQLSKTGGVVPSAAAADEIQCYRLHLGGHVLTLPRPEFANQNRERQKSVDGFDVIEDGFLECSIPSNAPELLSPYVLSDNSNNSKISCHCDATIQEDLLAFRNKVGMPSRDLIYSLLCGRPVVIITQGDSATSDTFFNALSLFVTNPARLCTQVLDDVTTPRLSEYTLLRCSSPDMTQLESFAQNSLCSYIYPHRRVGKVALYSDGSGSTGLVSRIWGVRSVLPAGAQGEGRLLRFERREDLFKFVQSGLVSELGVELSYKFYKILTNKQFDLDSLMGTATAASRDSDYRIFKHQIVELFNTREEPSYLSGFHQPTVEIHGSLGTYVYRTPTKSEWYASSK